MPGCCVLVNDAFLPRPVEEHNRLLVRLDRLGSGGTADLLERGAELAAVSTIQFGPSTGLTHTFSGGPDSGHGNLVEQWSKSGAAPENQPANLGPQLCKIKQHDALTWFFEAYNVRRLRT